MQAHIRIMRVARTGRVKGSLCGAVDDVMLRTGVLIHSDGYLQAHMPCPHAALPRAATPILPVHRRAGRVFTLLRPEDVRHFKGLLRKVDNTYVKDFALPVAAMAALRPRVDAALAATLPDAVVPVRKKRGA